MSEINTSIISNIPPPMHCSTFNLTPNDTSDSKNDETSTEIPIDKTNTDLATDNNKSDRSGNLRGDAKAESKIALPKLKIISNDVSMSTVEKDVFEVNLKETPSPNTPRQKKPIMGKTALLSRANVERNDVLIIQEIVSGKYSPVTQALQSRMHRRRRIRQDTSEDEYSDTVFSTPPNYSPLSTSTIGTTHSAENESGFYFPSKDVKDLRFLKSTDDVNVDTTIEDLEESSLNSSAASNAKSTSCSEYDPRAFLNNALGGLRNGSLESGIIQEEPEKKEVCTKPEDYSVRTSDISSLLSRTNGLYSSIKNSIKKKSIKLLSTPQNDERVIKKRQSVICENSVLENLMRELSIQNEIMFQVSKALDYCRTMKGFESTVEFIEAEKILLVASCTKAALTKEIENVEDDTFERKDDSKSCGQVYLSNFKFSPKKDEVKSGTLKEFTEQFVMVLTCGSTVLASDVIFSDEGGVVQIDKSFEFKNLTPDFEILVCIYAMRVPNKPHHNQERGNCPLPKKLFHHKISRKYKVTSETFYIRPSSFILWGKGEIRSPDLSKINANGDDNSPPLTLKMYNVPLSSPLSGMFSVNIKSNVTLSNRTSGFLTIGQENEHGCTLWNRRWCVLEGTLLKYWNYPSEEVTAALGCLDLVCCLDQQISGVDRSLCARPRTLTVPVKYKEGTKNYLLSADNLSDMKQWEKEINYVLRTLSLWNCICLKIP